MFIHIFPSMCIFTMSDFVYTFSQNQVKRNITNTSKNNLTKRFKANEFVGSDEFLS